MTRPRPLRPLQAAFRGAPGVIVRPFADQRGAVVIGPTAVAFVEVGEAGMPEPTADYLYRLDHALGRPTFTAVVRTEADIAAVAAMLRR